MYSFIITALGIWLIPFIVSFPFFNKEGELTTSFAIFKVTMAIVLSVSTYFLTKRHFARHKPESMSRVIVSLIGFITVSVILDLITVVPMMDLGYQDYTLQIVSFYMLILVIGLSTAKSKMVE